MESPCSRRVSIEGVRRLVGEAAKPEPDRPFFLSTSPFQPAFLVRVHGSQARKGWVIPDPREGLPPPLPRRRASRSCRLCPVPRVWLPERIACPAWACSGWRLVVADCPGLAIVRAGTAAGFRLAGFDHLSGADSTRTRGRDERELRPGQGPAGRFRPPAVEVGPMAFARHNPAESPLPWCCTVQPEPLPGCCTVQRQPPGPGVARCSGPRREPPCPGVARCSGPCSASPWPRCCTVHRLPSPAPPHGAAARARTPRPWCCTVQHSLLARVLHGAAACTQSPPAPVLYRAAARAQNSPALVLHGAPRVSWPWCCTVHRLPSSGATARCSAGFHLTKTGRPCRYSTTGQTRLGATCPTGRMEWPPSLY